jgi:hypothetical protein
MVVSLAGGGVDGPLAGSRDDSGASEGRRRGGSLTSQTPPEIRERSSSTGHHGRDSPVTVGREHAGRATLHIHFDTAHLDAVRIAFTCDAFDRIARLVVVAFALDGAKDELHEGGECGPRPVAGKHEAEHPVGDGPFRCADPHTFFGFDRFMQTGFGPPCLNVLGQCLTEADVDCSSLTDDVLSAIEGAPGGLAAAHHNCPIDHGRWCCVKRLVVIWEPFDGDLVSRLLQLIGPQITDLRSNRCQRTCARASRAAATWPAFTSAIYWTTPSPTFAAFSSRAALR